MADTKFVEGIIVKEPHGNAPAFVIASLSFKVEGIIPFIEKHAVKGWMNAQIKKSKGGKLYLELNEWKPKNKPSQNNSAYETEHEQIVNDAADSEDLPF